VWELRSHFKNPLGYGSLCYEIASSSGENVLAVSQRIHLRAFSPCILALSQLADPRLHGIFEMAS
jgi:hypothetical protein